MMVKDIIKQEWLEENIYTEKSIKSRIKEVENEFDMLEDRLNNLEAKTKERIENKFFPYHEYEVRENNGTKSVYKHTRFKLFDLVKKYDKQIVDYDENTYQEPLKFNFSVEEIKSLIKYQHKIEFDAVVKMMNEESLKLFNEILEIYKKYPDLFSVGKVNKQ